MIRRRLGQILTGNRAETDPAHPDPGLRTRTYAVPFERVWRAALAIARDRRGWEVVRADDLEGVVEIEAKTPVFRFVDDVELRVDLDPDAQTRVNVVSESRRGRTDLGINARRVRRFFKHLDRKLDGAQLEPRLGRRAVRGG